ncbi:MAG TPA: beta-phosphoglucomutase family hydrolase, partial [Micromonosporaceae bacterium]|nr:beta-phosphoglucomutase family hydrolase [Micromonosporaceae bacterium]
MAEPISITRRLGLPDDVTACLFDLDGVLTDTASVHAAAWARTFDEFLRERALRTGEPFVPFSPRDYTAYVDGKRREDGVRDFLASRGVVLPPGQPDDPPGDATYHAVGNRKNELLLAQLAGGVEVYEGSRRYLELAKAGGMKIAVVSSSANTPQVLTVTGMARFVDARVDGVVARERQLPGKPAPDTFLLGAELLGVAPKQAVVFEDALAGVAAGRAGGFGLVVGVDRAGHAEALLANGADVVVQDLA